MKKLNVMTLIANKKTYHKKNSHSIEDIKINKGNEYE